MLLLVLAGDVLSQSIASGVFKGEQMVAWLGKDDTDWLTAYMAHYRLTRGFAAR